MSPPRLVISVMNYVPTTRYFFINTHTHDCVQLPKPVNLLVIDSLGSLLSAGLGGASGGTGG